jgi:glycosyltransferase involved in cell wall biosynthesis
MTVKACFLGSARYSQPLDRTNRKKFRVLKPLGEMFVIGFSRDLYPRRFTEHAHFYLLPQLPLSTLRYIEAFVLGQLLTCWVIFRHGVRVIVTQSPYEGFTAALAKKVAGWVGCRVALVVETHGDFEESVFMQRRVVFPKLYRFLMRHVAGFTFKHADALRTISNSTRRQLERWVRGRPIIQFPAWTDIEVFLETGRSERNTHASEILYTGVLIPRKGVHHLIKAFASVADHFSQARLVIVGHEENKTYAAELKEDVEQFGLKERVKFVSVVSQEELARRMGGACTLVLPSLSEGLGRVIVEAMATGTPVVGSRVGGIQEMVQDGATGFLVPPGDEASLAERLQWLLEHPREAEQMGRKAHDFAQRYFSTETFVRGYGQIFHTAQTVLADNREHAP